jgi:hypothetical protein
MGSLLRTATIIYQAGEGKPVETADTFRTHRRPTCAEAEDVEEIRRCITGGIPLADRFYSARAGFLDKYLKDYGIMHLHVGGAGQTVLFVVTIPTA